MKPLGHVMILASAGSGKTYALTNRFVELLARGAAPERIVALTFTRKAAGEFFDEIVNKLARAARDADAAAKLARDIGAPELGAQEFRRMLRDVVDAMHRLKLGTLDSFFARIARVFPLELGLAGEFEILEEHAARLERQRVLRRLFARAADATGSRQGSSAGELDAAQKEFIEAFKRATFGAEEKLLGPKLDAFLDAHQERFLDAPGGALWGDRSRIWPDGNPWLDAQVDRSAAAGVLRAWLAGAAVGEKQRERWSGFLAEAEAWSPGITPPAQLAYVLKKALDAWPALTAGRAVLEFDRKRQELSAEACAALADLTRHVIAGELLRRLATTRGIHAVLRAYERLYHDSVRRAGKLTFGDVQRLLSPATGTPPLSSRAASHDDPGAAERTEADAEARLLLEYRLDAQIDHWLLDEFQDTSHGQWSVLRNLIDEVVQDPSGTRSFFCVGDVKQAIFTWREGDPRLFREIFNHYNAVAPHAIIARHLVESWRSGPPVIAMVNAVLGAAPVIEELFPGPAAKAWNGEWRTHVSAVPQRTGQAALLFAADEQERWARTVQLLHELRPLERGLTCAVLVPKNSTATELADYLRREGGLPALAESDLHVCVDNPLGAALLALAHAAAHPGDTLAWEHVQMTPLGAVLAAEDITTRERATERLLTQIHADGFERAMEMWLRKIEARLAPGDAFSRTRARQFAAAAARYDRTGSRDVAEFVAFMERHVVRDPESAGVVRVMTIHKSKGLGFDVVILPDLQGKRIDERRTGLAVQKEKDREVQWVFDLPPKLFCEADDVLSRHVRTAEAEACYESLSLLYVALTRAKRAMYAIIEPVGKSVSRNYPKLMAEALGQHAGHDHRPGSLQMIREEQIDVRVGSLTFAGLWARGDAGWHLEVSAPPRPAKPEEDLAPIAGNTVQRVVRREVRRPSREGAARLSAAQVFALERSGGPEFGAAVHALLAEIEWAAPGELVAREASWRERGAEEEAMLEVLSCLRAPELAAIWMRPPGVTAVEVWRERAFEVVLDGAWITGVFDRVVIERDAAGRPAGATVFDFKTDRIKDDAELAQAASRHAGQLNLYRDVTAVLLGLPGPAIAAELVFTRLRRRVRVTAPPLEPLTAESHGTQGKLTPNEI